MGARGRAGSSPCPLHGNRAFWRTRLVSCRGTSVAKRSDTMKLLSSQLLLVSLTLSASVHAQTRRGNRPNEDINVAYRDLGLNAANEKDLGHSGATEMTKKFTDHAQACSVEAKRRLDASEAASSVVKVTAFAGGPRELKLGDVEATVCRPLADKAKSWDASVKSAHDAVADAVAAPYKAVGIGGDKLAWIVSQKGDSDFSRRGRQRPQVARRRQERVGPVHSARRRLRREVDPRTPPVQRRQAHRQRAAGLPAPAGSGGVPIARTRSSKKPCNRADPPETVEGRT
jgi:hypothetical protein